MNEVREEVRRRYAESALAVISGDARSCCPDKDTGTSFGSGLYEAEERGELPDSAVLASLGCGNPIAVADLREGETVLDLGSGGGIDVLLSARRVGDTGLAYGLDMTDEMLELAQRTGIGAQFGGKYFCHDVRVVRLPRHGASCPVAIAVSCSADRQALGKITPDGVFL